MINDAAAIRFLPILSRRCWASPVRSRHSARRLWSRLGDRDDRDAACTASRILCCVAVSIRFASLRSARAADARTPADPRPRATPQCSPSCRYAGGGPCRSTRRVSIRLSLSRAVAWRKRTNISAPFASLACRFRFGIRRARIRAVRTTDCPQPALGRSSQ
jgi:hypothetical protein